MECGAVAPLCNEVSRPEKSCFFTLVRALWSRCLSLQCLGRTRLRIVSQTAARTSSPPAPIFKTHHFSTAQRLDVLQRGLLSISRDFSWILEAWAVFSNHYHFVAHSPTSSEDASSLSQMLGVLHARTAGWINGLDGKPTRKVWHNFWDTKLTYEKSYLARLNYVHQNAVKHGLVHVANHYQWCSARWFEQVVPTAMVQSIYRFKIDQISVRDDFAPIVE